MTDPTADGRRLRGDASRQLLIDAMIRAVARHGLPGATISVVAELAGVSRSLVNFHFTQKDQLLESALAHALHCYQQSLAVVLRHCPGTPRARLEADILHDIRFAADHPDLLALWYASWSERQSLQQYRDTTLAADRDYRAGYAACFAPLLASEELARRCAHIIDSFIDGLWLDCHLDPSSFLVDDACDTALLLLDALLTRYAAP
ncbi:TetR family transcriptional regulator C-terminal domain-containing protein [uncultured Aquitalea sp.]|uniref:TetR family transcriptional regulator C-terminal domain-containing protein n=1 Tax=uncultured Aquitalea sp. TaxID=540272 RepID=UPI0025FC69BF|nr:TetR family transcriptional regulator C-terminal domain-containing protein [uncultured Aquitalea sp.]